MTAAVGRIVSAQTGDRMQVIRQEHGAANKRFERTPEIGLPFYRLWQRRRSSATLAQQDKQYAH